MHVVRVEDVIFDVVEGPEVKTEDVGDGYEPHQQRAAWRVLKDKGWFHQVQRELPVM